MRTDLRFEQWAAMAAITLLVIGCFLVLRPFISSLLWAGIICFSTWPFYLRLSKLFRRRRTPPALVMTALVGFVMVIPFAIVGLTLADNLGQIIEFLKSLAGAPLPTPPAWMERIPLAGPILAENWYDLSTGTGDMLGLIKDLLQRNEKFLLRSGLKLGQGVLQLTLSVLIAFFFYRDGESLGIWINDALKRLAGEHALQVMQAVGGTIKGVVYGILGTAIAQGIMAGIGFQLAGITSPFLLGFLTFCLSIIQVGPPLIWVPATLWLLATEQTGRGLFMAAWGVLVISGIDNLLRPYLISRGANLPLVVILLGVMGGILAFGFMGIFLGPTLLVVAGGLLRRWITRERNPAPPA